MFPGRCFGLAVGIGEFQTSHWVSTTLISFLQFPRSWNTETFLWVQVWWIPDILAAALHGFLYMTIPPYMKPYPTTVGVEVGNV